MWYFLHCEHLHCELDSRECEDCECSSILSHFTFIAPFSSCTIIFYSAASKYDTIGAISSFVVGLDINDSRLLDFAR